MPASHCMLPLPSTDTNRASHSSRHFALSNSVNSRARLRSAGCIWRTSLDASQLFRPALFGSAGLTPTPSSQAARKSRRATGIGGVRVCHNSLFSQPGMRFFSLEQLDGSCLRERPQNPGIPRKNWVACGHPRAVGRQHFPGCMELLTAKS